MLEPVQGEGGARVPDPDYLKEVKRRCREREALLILDEVQTGLGRTGTLFCYEQFETQPDIMTLAKALGNGLPIGALLATDEAASAFQPGNQAATFGGNTLVTAVAETVLSELLKEGFLAEVRDKGVYFKKRLGELKEKFPLIQEVRGLGLLLGLVLDRPGKPYVDACLAKGFLINCTQETILRFAPPLIVSQGEIDALIEVLEEVFKELS